MILVTKKECGARKCGRIARKRGYCYKHYSRLYRNGSVEAKDLGRSPSNEGKGVSYRAAYVRAYKLEHGCADCGYMDHPAALDFDHRPGTVKVRDIKSGQQLGWKALLAEMAKCDVVCANCHRIRTFERQKEVMTVSTQQRPLAANV